MIRSVPACSEEVGDRHYDGERPDGERRAVTAAAVSERSPSLDGRLLALGLTGLGLTSLLTAGEVLAFAVQLPLAVARHSVASSCRYGEPLT